MTARNDVLVTTCLLGLLAACQANVACGHGLSPNDRGNTRLPRILVSGFRYKWDWDWGTFAPLSRTERSEPIKHLAQIHGWP